MATKKEKGRDPKWSDAAAWECAARSYELAAELTRKARVDGRASCGEGSKLAKASFFSWRDYRAALEGAGFGVGRVDREVRRAHALATGRLVREEETAYAVRRDDGEVPATFSSRICANDYATSADRPSARTYRVTSVRVTRIRRAT